MDKHMVITRTNYNVAAVVGCTDPVVTACYTADTKWYMHTGHKQLCPNHAHNRMCHNLSRTVCYYIYIL